MCILRGYLMLADPSLAISGAVTVDDTLPYSYHCPFIGEVVFVLFLHIPLRIVIYPYSCL
jgi:hypothetical protein